MFTFLHKRSKSITVYVLFGAIILVFVFFRYNAEDNSIGGYAARVNHHTISLTEYKQMADSMSQYYSNLFGGKVDNAEQQKMIQASALERLISQELLAQGADNAGLAVSDVEVKDFIVSVPAFQKDGRFQRDYYNGYLSSRGLASSQFEDQLRRELLTQKAQRFLGDVLTPLDAEVQRERVAREAKVNLQLAALDSESLAQTMKGDEATAKKSLQDPAFEKRVKEKYEANKAQYSNEEQIRARHILIKSENPASDAKAQEKIKDIAEKAKKQDFGSLAAQYSEDPGSKAQKGDLGFFAKGRMVPEFEKAAFEAEIGKVIGPVKTPFGYHLIKVEEKKAAHVSSYEDVRLEIARHLLGEEKAKAVIEQASQLVKEGNLAGLEKLMKEHNLKWEETGFFSKVDETIPKIGTNEMLLKEIAEMTPEKPLAKTLAQVGPRQYIVKLKEAKTTSEAETPVSSLKSELAQAQSYDVLMRWTEQMKTDAKIVRNNRALRLE